MILEESVVGHEVKEAVIEGVPGLSWKEQTCELTTTPVQLSTTVKEVSKVVELQVLAEELQSKEMVIAAHCDAFKFPRLPVQYPPLQVIPAGTELGVHPLRTV